MKKLMIALAVAAMAVCSNAAVVKWNAVNVRTPSATDPTQAESGIVPSASAAFLSGVTFSLLYNGSTISTGTSNANGAIAATQFWDQAAAVAATRAAGSNTLTFNIIATYEDANGTYTYSGSKSADLSNVVSGTKDVSVLFNAGSVGSWDYSPKAVPEPTSGLLLLLGMAGLALRRRRA